MSAHDGDISGCGVAIRFWAKLELVMPNGFYLEATLMEYFLSMLANCGGAYFAQAILGSLFNGCVDDR